MQIKAPCGDIITVAEKDGQRTYWYKGKMIWNPKEVHRVGLMLCMLHEDSCKYKSLQKLKIEKEVNNG